MAAPGRSRVDLDTVWREESRKVLATLIRLLRDFDLAEEALHDAFVDAARKWPEGGLPQNPAAWLVSAGRFRAIDRLRRRARLGEIGADLALLATEAAEPGEAAALPDDRLRLIFTCCHPALPPEAQVALTLREVCGLTTEEVARAFVLRTPTVAQRIVRAKQRIREAGLRYEIPATDELHDRLGPVLSVIYLVFNEGYLAHSGDLALRTDLSAEAVRLCRLVAGLLPDAEVLGLLGLMLLHESRRAARLTEGGDVVLLDQQDRSRWDRDMIAEGTGLVERAFATRQIGPYALQGAIAAVHASAATPGETDWAEIVGLYAVLLRVAPSPVIRLNHAIAVSKLRGPAEALKLIAPLLDSGELADYHLAHVAEADMLRQLGQAPAALAAYRRALATCRLEPERRLIRLRMADLGAA